MGIYDFSEKADDDYIINIEPSTAGAAFAENDPFRDLPCYPPLTGGYVFTYGEIRNIANELEKNRKIKSSIEQMREDFKQLEKYKPENYDVDQDASDDYDLKYNKIRMPVIELVRNKCNFDDKIHSSGNDQFIYDMISEAIVICMAYGGRSKI